MFAFYWSGHDTVWPCFARDEENMEGTHHVEGRGRKRERERLQIFKIILPFGWFYGEACLDETVRSRRTKKNGDTTRFSSRENENRYGMYPSTRGGAFEPQVRGGSSKTRERPRDAPLSLPRASPRKPEHGKTAIRKPQAAGRKITRREPKNNRKNRNMHPPRNEKTEYRKPKTYKKKKDDTPPTGSRLVS